MSRYHQGLPAWNDARPILFRIIVIFGDAMSVAVGYAAAYSIRFYSDSFLAVFPVTKGIPPISGYLLAAPIILFMWVMSLSWVSCYSRISFPALDEAIRIGRASALGTLTAMSSMFLYRETTYSRLVFLLGGGLSFFSVYLFRQSMKSFYVWWIRMKHRPRRVLILGGGYLSKNLQKILEREGDRAILRKHHFVLDEIIKTIRRSRINDVLVAKANVDHVDHNDIIKLATFCEDHGVMFRLLPDILELRLGEVLIDESLGIPTLHLKPVSLHGSAFLVKRVIDLSVSCLLVGIFFVPFLMMALMIKITSKGPIFYHHARMGFKGRSFQFMKFRTMVTNADDLLKGLRDKSDRTGPVFKMKSDPRITIVGKLMRRLSMDELPQLINVLRGEMSLIGPRPQVLWEAAQYSDWAKKRLNVLPGITGLWQVSGRAELTYDEMIDLDIFYIEHWSPGLDLKILAKTLPAVLFGKGAY